MDVNPCRANLEDFRAAQWEDRGRAQLQGLTAGVEAIYEENVGLLPCLTGLLQCLTVLASLERVVLQVELPCATGYRLKPQFLSSLRSAYHSAVVPEEKLHERSSV